MARDFVLFFFVPDIRSPEFDLLEIKKRVDIRHSYAPLLQLYLTASPESV